MPDYKKDQLILVKDSQTEAWKAAKFKSRDEFGRVRAELIGCPAEVYSYTFSCTPEDLSVGLNAYKYFSFSPDAPADYMTSDDFSTACEDAKKMIEVEGYSFGYVLRLERVYKSQSSAVVADYEDL